MSDETSHPRENPAPPAPAAVPLQGLMNRLKLPRASARRSAIIDLCRRPEPEALAALSNHLPRETDQPALLRIIVHLGSVRYAPALSPLRALADDPHAPVDLAHAALIAADRIERSA